MITVDEITRARTRVDDETRQALRLKGWLEGIGVAVADSAHDHQQDRVIDCLACCSDCSFAYCHPGNPMCGHICYDNCCGQYCWDNCFC
jgi:hypothetical protein